MAFSSGCVSSGEQTQDPQTTDTIASASLTYSQPADRWQIDIMGSVRETLTNERYGELKKTLIEPMHYQSISISSRGTSRTYEGIPVAALLQSIHPSLTAERWERGYEITLSAQDGYSISFSTQDIAANTLILYTPWTPKRRSREPLE